MDFYVYFVWVYLSMWACACVCKHVDKCVCEHNLQGGRLRRTHFGSSFSPSTMRAPQIAMGLGAGPVINLQIHLDGPSLLTLKLSNLTEAQLTSQYDFNLLRALPNSRFHWIPVRTSILTSKSACFVYSCTYPVIRSECNLMKSVYAYLWNLRYQPVNWNADGKRTCIPALWKSNMMPKYSAMLPKIENAFTKVQ